MQRIYSAFLATLGFAMLCLGGQAQAQTPGTCDSLNWVEGTIRYDDGAGHCYTAKINSDGTLNISGTFSATLGALNPTFNGIISGTTTSSRVHLTGTGTGVIVQNSGAVDAWVKFGDVTVAATVADTRIPACGVLELDAGSGTYIAGITASSTTSLYVTQGAGLSTAAVGCTSSGGTSSAFGAAVPASGTAAGFSDGTNMQAARAFDGDTGGGTQYVQGAILRKSASGGTVEAGTSSDPLRTDPTGTTTQPISILPQSASTAAATNVHSAALESNHVLKASAGNLYSGAITTGATGGWLLSYDGASAPTAGGAAIAPVDCVVAPANATTSMAFGPVPEPFATGIVLVFSTSGCLTNTASTTAYFNGNVK